MTQGRLREVACSLARHGSYHIISVVAKLFRARGSRINLLKEQPASTVVVLAPHVDDEVIGCGGAIRSHCCRGDTVVVIYLTDGCRCGRAVSFGNQFSKQREEEARQITDRLLGVKRLVFLRLPDGKLQKSGDAVAKIATILERWRPRAVYLPFISDWHSDHIATNHLFLSACSELSLQNELLIRAYEVQSPMGPVGWRLLSPMDRELTDLKHRALLGFRSQVIPIDSIMTLNRSYGHLTQRATAAEVFYECHLTEYRNLVKSFQGMNYQPLRIDSSLDVPIAFLLNWFWNWHMFRMTRPRVKFDNERD